MGAKLGNIHIRNASAEEVSALLPKALVGQWGEGFVSVYHEDLQWGTAEREGKRLSRKLPAATVLTAALFDDDVVSFEVYKAGKRLTGHLLNPYEDQNKPGNIKLFCEVLGLLPEDEKRLKVLWKKGDACEQMDLTAALLGLPLWADPQCPPREKTLRDTDTVDAWIADHPDPPKVKSVTKTVVVQEIPEVVKPKRLGNHFFALSAVSGIKEEKETFGPYSHIYVWYLISHESLYRLNDDGLLELVIQRERQGEAFCTEAYSLEKTEFRSAGENRIIELQMTETPFHWKVTWDSDDLAVGEAGSSEREYGGFFAYSPPSLEHSALSLDGKTLFTAKWKQGLQLTDAETGELRRELKMPAAFFGTCADGSGRFWAQTGDRTIEGYDENLRLISRHRLKGDIMALRANPQGELMAYTYNCAYKSDDRTFRVYRIS